ncbi:MAG: patatin family protein [Clostridia bacterium]|nr:patatin family protein [Clostridia bacterium]
MKVGLVLEGGAMRGMYTMGVLDAMMDDGFMPDGLFGVSAGILFGVNLLSHQRSRALRYNQRFMGDPRNCGLRSLLTTGNIINKEFAYYRITKEFDIFDEATFEKNNKETVAVVTNLRTGGAEYININHVLDQMEVLRASSSMPFVSRSVAIGDEWYLDGGVAESVPYEECFRRGYDKVIIVLTQPKTYVKSPMKQGMIRLFYGRHKAFARALQERHNVYNRQQKEIEQLEREGRVFVIRPEAALDIKRLETDPLRMAAVHAIGLADGRARLAAMHAYLRG